TTCVMCAYSTSRGSELASRRLRRARPPWLRALRRAGDVRQSRRRAGRDDKRRARRRLPCHRAARPLCRDDRVPAAGTLPRVEVPAASEPTLQVSVPSLLPFPARVQAAPLAERKFRAAGRSPTSVTPVAFVGPAFAIVVV